MGGEHEADCRSSAGKTAKSCLVLLVWGSGRLRPDSLSICLRRYDNPCEEERHVRYIITSEIFRLSFIPSCLSDERMANFVIFPVNDTSPTILYSPFADTLSTPNLSAGWNPYYTLSGFASVLGEVGDGTSLHITSNNGSFLVLQWNGMPPMSFHTEKTDTLSQELVFSCLEMLPSPHTQ